jgi:hypothetical protein
MNTSEQAAPQADSPTLEQRAASIFGDAPKPQPKQMRAEPEQTDQAPAMEDATNESPQGEDSTAPQFEEVEYEGELYQVPPKLKEAVIRQSDYTKKTQEVAEQRKLVEHQQSQLRVMQEQANFEKAVAPQLSEINRIDAQLAQYDQLNWRELDAENRTLHMLEMQRLEKLKAVKENEIKGKQQEHSQKLNEQMRKLQAEANDVLKTRVPGWNESVAKEVGKWAVDNGFTQEEVSNIYDPRHAEVLWKAAQYDKARNGAKPSVAQAKAAKPTSSNPMPQHVKDKLNFRKELGKTQQGTPERRKLLERQAANIFK